MSISFQFFSVFLLGLVGGSVPGPILAAAFTEALRNGFLKSLRVILMAMATESLVAIFVVTMFFSFNIPQMVFSAISLAGVAVLVWLAVQVWSIKELSEGGTIFSFSKIFLLTIFNGPFWVFWITVCVPQALLLRKEVPGGHVLFLILFELGWLVATACWTLLFSRFRPLLSKQNIVPIVFKIFALILLFFAVRLLFESFTFLPQRFSRPPVSGRAGNIG